MFESPDKGVVGLEDRALPQPFVARMSALLQDEFPAFLATYSSPPERGIRANRLKIAREELAERMGLTAEPVPWNPDGLYCPPSLRPGWHPYHAAGLYYGQEPSAMVVAPLVGARPGERVLDLAAAPGGKTTQLAAQMENRGLLVANEVDPGRVRALVENLERLGITCAAVVSERPERLAERLPGFFDRVLVDAPCSGEGMFRKTPEVRDRWRPDMPEACARVQGEILDSAVELLRPGGRLVYSTCTFAPEENEEVLLQLLTRRADLRMLPLPPVPGIAPGRPEWTRDPARAATVGVGLAGRLWPHRVRGEGHFVAVLERVADGAGRQRPPLRRDWQRPSKEALADFRTFCRETLTPAGQDALPPEAELRQHGEWLFAPPADSRALVGMHVVRAGLQLGRALRGRFEPSHPLALALRPGHVQRVRDLAAGSPELLAYLRGETLPAGGERGWTLVTVDGFPLGWAKAANGILKNHYPKVLRWDAGAPEPIDPES
ncbi:MAG: SAM-dependent methyltransferase [Symbiobacterium thermophilum]|uniref:SAM-dependent methyltransferase n=1 Tax=Symbiobacterium thermophilum TaxID=2734 RepID=A0A953I9U8_SYMTR|nr:SAM-dependent methyltransferase [Symbiobacterium thermophilum]